MTYLNITPSEDVPAISGGHAPGPATFDAAEIRALLDSADAALAAADRITDADAAEAVRQLARGLNSAGVLLVSIASAIHRGNVAVMNYPDAL